MVFIAAADGKGHRGILGRLQSTQFAAIVRDFQDIFWAGISIQKCRNRVPENVNRAIDDVRFGTLTHRQALLERLLQMLRRPSTKLTTRELLK